MRSLPRDLERSRAGEPTATAPPDAFAFADPHPLARAGRAVLASRPAEDGLEEALVGLVRQLLDANWSPQHPRAATPVRRQLFAELRGALLTEWESTPPTDPTIVIRLLKRFEALDPARADARKASFLGSGGFETAAEIAHDFRSPLGSILMLTDMLLREQSGPVTPLQQGQLAIVYSAALALSSFAEDIVDLVRGGSGLVEPEPRPFSLGDMLISLRALVGPLADSKGLELQLACDASRLRSGYPFALRRVLLNLVTNAVKYTNAGRVEVSISRARGDCFHFQVIDGGRGLPDDVLSRLRAPGALPPPRRISSSALGLRICQNLLRAMGSELAVESSPSGSRFHFELRLPPHVAADSAGQEV